VKTESLIAGVRVVDAGGEPAALGGRILADLGADVVRLEPPGGDPLRRVGPHRREPAGVEGSLRFAAWNAGKTSVELAAGDPRLASLLEAADVVIDTPGWPGSPVLDAAQAPQAVWVRVTPFGLAGPRAGWRATDLGIVAASGNMHATGYPDRPPLRCTEPTAYNHGGPEIAVAALTGLASGRPQVIDLSLQEAYLVADMGFVGEQCQNRSTRTFRAGPTVLGMKEIWRCKDGWVSFGLRGGVARVATLQFMAAALRDEGLANAVWSERDWAKFNIHDLDDDERAALVGPLERYFARHTMQDLYAMAAANGIMLAPCNTPRELYHSEQLAARSMFGKLGDIDGFPIRFALAQSADGCVASPAARRPAPRLGVGPLPPWERRRDTASRPDTASLASACGAPWAGVTIVEFGSGAAGPIASRYFAEHGARVIRVESKKRPDFLRAMAVAARNPHGVEGDVVFNAINVGKQSITLDLKHPDGVGIARRLIERADLVLENFAPKAMRGFGLDYDTLAAGKPDLLMVSSCLNGQTGPHRDYPGFGSQGAALSGYTHLTAFPDRPPTGPMATITDSLAPRFVAVAMAAALLYKRRTRRGVRLDLSQVETAVYTLAPWMLDYAVNGRIAQPNGNRSDRAVPHGAFPCRGDDAWVAIAVWSDCEWRVLAGLCEIDLEGCETLDGRRRAEDEIERRLGAWTARRSPLEVAGALQGRGIEAVPVQSFPDVFDDPQLRARGHFEVHLHPVRGEFHYERNGFRLSGAASGYPGPAPVLGQHTDEVLADFLGCSDAEIAALKESGGVE
jgi:crotonobetainyl-CoA:carnitine CoA-transferase CaiB-like acyl-CoA transferase